MLHDKQCHDKLGRRDDFLTRRTVADAEMQSTRGGTRWMGKKLIRYLETSH